LHGLDPIHPNQPNQPNSKNCKKKPNSKKLISKKVFKKWDPLLDALILKQFNFLPWTSSFIVMSGQTILLLTLQIAVGALKKKLHKIWTCSSPKSDGV
jgi:hypothetical protein